jgi:predicted ester cyclase
LNKQRDHRAPALRRENMPTDYSISLDSYIGRQGYGLGYQDNEQRIPTDFGPKQSLGGFEETYQNIIDYIVRITHTIWEERDIDYIGDTYSPQSQVFDDYGLQYGNQKIIGDTHHTTGAFSDIKLIADEVIWAGNDEVGFHTSHRTIIRGTNDGDSKYGPATGKTVDVLVIANCVALENDIFLEHVLYNNSSLVQQLGFELHDTADSMSATPPAGWPRDKTTWESLRQATNPGTPISISQPISGFDVDAFARNMLNQLWNERNFDALNTCYRNNFSFAGATDRSSIGAKNYQRMLSPLFTAFPDLELQVDEVYWMGNEKDGFLSSERWSATATHTGPGLYGEATGQQVQIWGITQHRIVSGLVVNEWMLFNELDLMMQISKARHNK